MAAVVGMRSTSQAITEDRLIRRVDSDISMLEPNEAPLVTLFNKMNKRESTDNPRFEWYEDDYNARWTQNGSTTVANNSASTTITASDGTLFSIGDIVVVPKLISSSAKPELVRVTAISTNTLTVVRDVGSNGIDTIAANAALSIIGNAFEEGGSIPVAKTVAPVKKTGYTQIFRTTVNYSKTNVATNQYGTSGSDRKREHRKKLKEHKILLNRALLFGKASESLTGGPTSQPIRTTDGINSVITTNITDAGGLLTKKTFEAFSRSAFRYGKEAKLLLASPILKSAINEWAKAFLQVKPAETKFGVQIQQVQTAHGTWMLVNDWMLEDGVSGQNGFGSIGLSLDLTQFKYRFLSGNGENRDTHITMDKIQDGRDAYVDEILTEAGYQIMQEKYHAKLMNISDYVE